MLGALSVNFFLNGFLIQAFITATSSVFLLVFMLRSSMCSKSGCNMQKSVKNSDGKEVEV